MSLSLSWSFDEGIRPATPLAHPRRSGWARSRRWLQHHLLSASGAAYLQVVLSVLVFVYLTLSGFTCLRWCELYGLTSSPLPTGSETVAAATHHHHSETSAPAAPSLDTGRPLDTSGPAIHAPDGRGLLAPVPAELPVPLVLLVVSVIVLVQVLWSRPVLRPAWITLPLHPPPPRQPI